MKKPKYVVTFMAVLGVLAVLAGMKAGKDRTGMKEPVIVRWETPTETVDGEYEGPLSSIWVSDDNIVLPEPVETFMDLGWRFEAADVMLCTNETRSAVLRNGENAYLSVYVANLQEEPVPMRNGVVVSVMQDTPGDALFHLEGRVRICSPMDDVLRVYGTPASAAGVKNQGRHMFWYENPDGSWIQIDVDDRLGVQRISVSGPGYTGRAGS